MSKVKINERSILLDESILKKYPIFDTPATGSMPRTYVLTHKELKTMGPACTLDMKTILPYPKVFVKIPMNGNGEQDYDPATLPKSLVKNLKLFASCKNESFIFPEAHITTGANSFNTPIGTVSEYIDGNNLWDVPFIGSFKQLEKNINKIAEDSELLTINKIKIYDLSIANVMYNNKSFKIIDCEEYKSTPRSNDVEAIRKHNDEMINNLLISIIKVGLEYSDLNYLDRNIYRTLENELKTGIHTRTEYLEKLQNTLEVKGNTVVPTLKKGRNIINLYR